MVGQYPMVSMRLEAGHTAKAGAISSGLVVAK